MNRKRLKLLVLVAFMLCFSGLLFANSAKAEETPLVNWISILQYPSKMTYGEGENLELSDMIVQGYFIDGTVAAISDYTIDGYDSSRLGQQTVIIRYQHVATSLSINVVPAKVTNITILDHSSNSHTLMWDPLPNASRYEIFGLDEITGTYNLLATTAGNYYTFQYAPGTIKSYRIGVVEYIYGMEYKGELSDVYMAATDPEAVTGLVVTESSTSSVTLSWNPVMGATGYFVYRSPISSDSYSYCSRADSTFYNDPDLAAATGYKYKVCAFTLNEFYIGEYSPVIETSTIPLKMALKFKAGDQKVRLSWGKVTGASSYAIYIGNEYQEFTLLANQPENGKYLYVTDGLNTGGTYSFYGVTRREINGNIYESEASDIITVTIPETLPTSTQAKLFADEAAFKNSWTYTSLEAFRKNVIYSKSIIIPGLINTNIDGFTSTSMCPQGITFAKDYLLITAYDLIAEENSVIYVIHKKTQKLLTTLMLPSKTHAGGIGYDGINVWVANGTKVSSIAFSQIEEAVQSEEPFYYISYKSNNSVGISASYITYYNEKLWVGAYNELQSTYLYSFTINKKEGVPSLKKVETMIMPTRVQGIAFTDTGYLILSRSCQLYKGLRGYIRQLDVYNPDFSKVNKGIVPLGELVNTVEMPSMNEGIAIDGSYLYVNFETGAFVNSSYQMDRVCAFKLSAIVKKAAK
ncbi:MAG: hypothetical protein K0S76_2593 [Herbinix sp.]|jgi:fibronectin type 3 domain-containing protein|nr:hypothetical protein [Herbinix sp.]